MKKFLLSLFLLSSLIANEETYVIEAKGDFGRELKELVEKHSKDNGVEVNIYEGKSENSYKNTKTLEFAKEQGERIYKDNCISCHGDMGTKRSNASVRKLSKMDAGDIYVSFRSYLSDPSYGSSAGSMIMSPIAGRITDTQLGYIIAYLKNDTTYVWGSSKPKENTNISRNPTSQGTYLK